jgi:hypothetical protein
MVRRSIDARVGCVLARRYALRSRADDGWRWDTAAGEPVAAARLGKGVDRPRLDGHFRFG